MNSKLRIPLCWKVEDESPYSVAIPDFLARGGDDWLTSSPASEPARKSDGTTWTYREALRAHAEAAAPGTKLADLPKPTPGASFRWTWSNVLSAFLTDTSGLHRASGGLNRRLDRDPSTVLGAELSARVDGDQQDHAVRFTGRARYYSALVSDQAYELEDSAFLEALYRFRLFSRQLGHAWYAPVPYAGLAIDTEFTPHPDTTIYPVHYLDLLGSAGVRIVPFHPLELKLGGALRRLVLDPEAATRAGVVLGFDLPRNTAVVVRGTPIDLEGSLDWFVSGADAGFRNEGRLRLRVLAPLVGWLGVAAGIDVYAFGDHGQSLALLSESSLSLTLRQAGASQWH